MDTGIKDFCIEYNKKLKNDKNIKENEIDFFEDWRERVTFTLNVYEDSPIFTGPVNAHKLFKLDEEDLKYLYDKYSKKIKNEMEQNIEKVKNNYKDVI